MAENKTDYQKFTEQVASEKETQKKILRPGIIEPIHLNENVAETIEAEWENIQNKPSTYPPSAHKASHENGGSDEINVAGLSGELADPQPPKAHKTSHENGGSDEINVAGLSGELADPQPPKAHNHDSRYYTETEIDGWLFFTDIDGGTFNAQSVSHFWDIIQKAYNINGGAFVGSGLIHIDGGAFV